jgi:hypothetical protein
MTRVDDALAVTPAHHLAVTPAHHRGGNSMTVIQIFSRKFNQEVIP